MKTPAGLLTSSPVSHKLLVPSKKYFMAAAILPKRVGLPKAKPAQFLRSSKLAYIAPLLGTSGATASHSFDTAGTVRIRASIPPCSTPRAI